MASTTFARLIDLLLGSYAVCLERTHEPAKHLQRTGASPLPPAISGPTPHVWSPVPPARNLSRAVGPGRLIAGPMLALERCRLSRLKAENVAMRDPPPRIRAAGTPSTVLLRGSVKITLGWCMTRPRDRASKRMSEHQLDAAHFPNFLFSRRCGSIASAVAESTATLVSTRAHAIEAAPR